MVLSVTHKGQPIQDATKLQRLQQLLFDMMDQKHQGIVTIKTASKRTVFRYILAGMPAWAEYDVHVHPPEDGV